MMNSIVLFVALFALFGSAFCDCEGSGNLQLSVFASSNNWWIAVAPLNGAVTTTKIEVQEAGASSWTAMTHSDGWNYFQLCSSGSSTGFNLPLSFRLTGSDGEQVTMQSVISSIVGGSTISTSLQYGGSSTATKAPTQHATQHATQAPTQHATQHATQAPTQHATQPTQRATQAPTQHPTQKATSAPNSNLCGVTSEPLKLLVPLYVYPGAAWTQVANGAKAGVETIAIINPNNGPLSSGPDSAYNTYMAQLKAAGVVMVGYVHTLYGARAIADVAADITLYATKYPGLAGIFVDEVSSSKNEISYYTQVYNAILSHSGFTEAIINPGTQPDQGYVAISTDIVVFESAVSAWKSNFPSFVTCAPSAAAKNDYKYKFSAIAYGGSQSQMTTIIGQMRSAGLGMVYVTDGTASGDTYGHLPSYYSAMVSAIAAGN